MTFFWRLAPWLTRLLLLASATLFFLIGLKYLRAPVENAGADAIILGSVMAISAVASW